MRWKIGHGGHDPRQVDLIAHPRPAHQSIVSRLQ